MTLVVPVCATCGGAAFPPRLLCPRCGSASWREEHVGGGVVEGVTEHRTVRVAEVRTPAGVVVAHLLADARCGDTVALAMIGDVPSATEEEPCPARS